MKNADRIETLRSLPAKVEALVTGLTAADLTTHFLLKADGSPEWTVAQNVHHLADAHMNSYIGFKLLLSEEQPTLLAYDENAWARQPESMTADISGALAILKHLHERWASLFETLNAADWQRIGVHPVGGAFILEDQFNAYVQHGEDHLDQIKRTLAARGQ